MIDKKLNYGRHIIENYAIKSMPYSTVLDIGAGSGSDLEIYQSVNPHAKLFAIESYQPNIDILMSKNIESFTLDIEKDKLPFENNSLDVITVNQVLEHVKEIFWILHEITRVLKVGGKLIIGVPNLASFHNRLLLLMGKQPTCIRTDSAHVRGYTKDSIIGFLKLLPGYEIKHFKGSNFYPFPPLLARPLANAFPSSSVAIFLCFHKTKEYNNNEFIKFPIKEQLETNYYLG